MQLAWSLFALVASSLLLQVLSMAVEVTTTEPEVITSSEEQPEPMLYHLIVDHRPTSLGQNYYLKPGQLVGTFSLDSGMLHVKHEAGKQPVSSKLNILFVATAKEQDVSTQSQLNEVANNS